MTKMTYANALSVAIEAVSDVEVKEKLEALKTSLARKSKGGERKPTAKQTENEGFKAEILDFMEDGVQYTITEISKGVESLAEMSNQRVSALVRQLKDSGLVERTEVKGKALFSKVVG